MTVLSELRNRGIEDVYIVACDGLTSVLQRSWVTWRPDRRKVPVTCKDVSV
uniref:Mutator family transposase n=1 Tax=Streptomyces sp. NBC_00180 TaxID=2903632 RepID=A0AAU1I8S8_9ACTN